MVSRGAPDRGHLIGTHRDPGGRLGGSGEEADGRAETLCTTPGVSGGVRSAPALRFWIFFSVPGFGHSRQ